MATGVIILLYWAKFSCPEHPVGSTPYLLQVQACQELHANAL